MLPCNQQTSLLSPPQLPRRQAGKAKLGRPRIRLAQHLPLVQAGHSTRPSASLGPAPYSTAARLHSPLVSAHHVSAARPAVAPYTDGPACPRLTSRHLLPEVSNLFPLLWPPAPIADASVRLPPLAAQAQTLHHLPVTTANPSLFQWPAAQASASLPPFATQAHASHFYPSLPPYASLNFPPQAPQADLSVRLPPPIVKAPASLPYSYLLNIKSHYSLFTATPLPVPSNAVTLEPPPVAHNIQAQILAGADIDLSLLLFLLPASDSNRLRGFFSHIKKTKHTFITFTFFFRIFYCLQLPHRSHLFRLSS